MLISYNKKRYTWQLQPRFHHEQAAQAKGFRIVCNCGCNQVIARTIREHAKDTALYGPVRAFLDLDESKARIEQEDVDTVLTDQEVKVYQGY